MLVEANISLYKREGIQLKKGYIYLAATKIRSFVSVEGKPFGWSPSRFNTLCGKQLRDAEDKHFQ